MKSILAAIAATPNTINELTSPLPEGKKVVGILSEELQCCYCWYVKTSKEEDEVDPEICAKAHEESGKIIAEINSHEQNKEQTRDIFVSILCKELGLEIGGKCTFWQDGSVSQDPGPDSSFSSMSFSSSSRGSKGGSLLFDILTAMR